MLFQAHCACAIDHGESFPPGPAASVVLVTRASSRPRQLARTFVQKRNIHSDNLIQIGRFTSRACSVSYLAARSSRYSHGKKTKPIQTYCRASKLNASCSRVYALLSRVRSACFLRASAAIFRRILPSTASSARFAKDFSVCSDLRIMPFRKRCCNSFCASRACSNFSARSLARRSFSLSAGSL